MCKGRPTARSAPTAVTFAVGVIAAALCCVVNSYENDNKSVKMAFKVLFLLLRSNVCNFAVHLASWLVCFMYRCSMTYCGCGCACLSTSYVRRPPQGTVLLPNCVLMHGLVALRYCLIRVEFVFWGVH